MEWDDHDARSADAKIIPLAQLALGLVLLAAWEIIGRTTGGLWTSQPSSIIVRLIKLAGGDLYWHTLITTSEMAIGLAIGASLGTVVGLILGYSSVLGIVLRPIVVVLYNIPLITLVPLFIFWFGFGMLPKVVLVSIAVFFIVFFNTFTGATKVDREMLQSVQTMGANPGEQFRKIYFPACLAWISAGVKIALPYSLGAAIVGEMLASRNGLGSLLSSSAAQFDMTGVYAVLFILMVLGMVLADLAVRLETFLLRWRHAAG